MKIISWNVNGLRAVERKENLGEFLNTYAPDIFLMQETKSKVEQVDFLDNIYRNYKKFYHSAEKPGYAGTGVWAKKELNITNIKRGFPAYLNYNDNEGRVLRVDIEIDGKNLAILSVYFPNGGKSSEAWDDKLIFYENFLEYVNEIRKSGLEVIWAGDINCAHNEIDLARPKDNEGKIGFHPRERAWIDKVIQNDWVDVWRKMYPEKKDVYSWWHVITRSRLRNVGWRIDYFFTDKKFFPKIKNIEYLNDQMGSDHCPVMLEI